MPLAQHGRRSRDVWSIPTVSYPGSHYAVFPPDTPLGAWFNASDRWERVYRDKTAAIWVLR